MSKKINKLKKIVPTNHRNPWLCIILLCCMTIFSSLSCKSSAVHEPLEKSTLPTQQQPEETPVLQGTASEKPCPPDEENQLFIEAYLAVHQLRGERTSSARLRRHSCQTMKDEVGGYIMYAVREKCGRYFNMGILYEPVIFLEQYLAWASANEKNSSHAVHKLLNFINTMPLPAGKSENHFCQPTERYCQEHVNCTFSGKCGLEAVKNDVWGTRNRCTGVTAEGCAASSECKASGKCTPAPDQSRCIAATPDDCKNSKGCETSGRCSPSPDQLRCIAATPDDCKNTEGCQTQGLCTPDDKGECVDPQEDCEDRAVCKLYGQCGTVSKTECEIRSHADCEASEACKEKGLCTAILRRQFYGSDYCSLEFDQDCEQTTACKEKGFCKLKPGEGCVKESGLVDGAGWPLDHVCPKDTRREVQRQCVVTHSLHSGVQKKCGQDFVICSPTIAYCKQQPACKSDGRCGVVDDLSSDAEQRYEYECSEADGNDKCTPGIKACGLSAEGCAQFEACPLSGDCSVHLVAAAYGYQESYEVCAPQSDTDCAQSQACKMNGACTYISSQMMPPESSNIDIPYCTPGSKKDCQQSEACKKENHCQFKPGGNLPYKPGSCIP